MEIKNNLEQNSNSVFFREFSLASYNEHWHYIHLNYTQPCKDLYAALTINLGALNNMSRLRQELILKPNNELPIDLPKMMLELASTTKPILDSIVGGCQQL